MSMMMKPFYVAWQKARKHKKPSVNQLAFEASWLDGLQDIQEQVIHHCWQPRRTVCFIATHPKTREIHAPDFADRVVHHYLVPQLQAIYEPVFIHDSYANRSGKGSHQAVARLQQFMRQVEGKPAFFLQLDIHNFFNSINRHTLYRQLGQRLAKAERQGKITAEKHHEIKTLCHALVNQKPAKGTLYRGTAAEHALVPPHKRLINARPGCGIAVGNLSSQFFANVYLNALDQFVKHTLKCRHYVRYVDDFVLLHHDPQQLLAWRSEIEAFLAAQLQLTLKQNANNRLPLPQPLANGCDFLGYIIYPQRKVVRRRVIQHCREKLRAWARSAGFGSAQPAVRDRSLPWEGEGWGGVTPSVAPRHLPLGRGSFSRSLSGVEGSQQIRALVASYWGHFGHASHWRLTERLLREFGWLRWLFLFRPGKPPIPRFACGTVEFFTDQIDFYRQMYPGCRLRVQKGYAWVDVLPAKANPDSSPNSEQPLPVVEIHECGWLRHGLKRREVGRIFYA